MGLRRLVREATAHFWAYPLHGAERYAPIFVVGSGRCGTTLLRRMLVAGGELVVPPEFWSLPGAFRRFRRVRSWPWRLVCREVVRELARDANFSTWGIGEEDVLRRALSREKTARSGAAIVAALYETYRDAQGGGSQRWGDKTPLNTWHLDEIHAFFPDATFINLVRDGVDVVFSLVGYGMQEADFLKAARRWTEAIELADRFRAEHPRSMIEIRYEDLVARPAETLERICTFAGLRFRPDMVHSEGVGSAILVEKPVAHHLNVTRPIFTESVRRGRRRLDGLDAELVSELARRMNALLERKGYEPIALSRPAAVRARRPERELDVLLVADPRFPGGTTAALAHEIEALSAAGLSVGLLRKPSAVVKRTSSPLNLRFARAIAAGRAIEIHPELVRAVRAGLVVLHHPSLFYEASAWPGELRIEAEQLVLVVHHLPVDLDGRRNFDPRAVHGEVVRTFGREPLWAPNSPLTRRALLEDGVGSFARLTEEDWTNILFAEEWAMDRAHPAADRPVIGRHGRADLDKWPDSRDDILAAWPDDPAFAVRILGYPEGLRNRLGGAFPANWQVLPFGAEEPARFLGGIDFFVYFHAARLRESFGRAPAEAALAGLPPIVPAYLRETFGEDGFVYAEPRDVRDIVAHWYRDWDAYRELGARARERVSRLCAPERHVAHVRRLLAERRDGSAALSGEAVRATGS